MSRSLLALSLGAVVVLAAPALADDILGKGGGGKGGGSGSGSGNSGGSAGSGSGGSRGGRNEPPPARSGGSQSGGQSGNRGSGSSSGSGGVGAGREPGRPSSSGNGKSGNDELLGRSGGAKSRSGDVRYGTVSNTGREPGRSNGPVRVNDAPITRNNGAIGREANREDRIVRNDPRYRNGYHHYDNRWRDDNYWYPHYQFNYRPDCVPSPWYYYQHLPAYVTIARIEWGGITFDIRSGNRYNWRDTYNNGNGNGWGWGRSDRNEIDDTVQDIRDAFQRRSARLFDSMIPSRERVTIDLEGRGSYSIGGDDFYDLMRDLVEGTRTYSYNIREVRVNRGQLTVVAEHEYSDPWGRRERQIHTYGLEEGRRSYEIVYFRTDRRW